jgi:AAA15 family ATPase/GTPase
MVFNVLESIKIEGLRGIVEADIEGFAPVTFFVGSNGSGKSTVLEAIGVACAGDDAVSAFHALSAREWLGLKTFEYLFKGENEQAKNLLRL